MDTDRLAAIMRAQRDLQRDSFGLDPAALTGEARAQFVRWNVLALEDELHEALAETKWKPWLTEGHGDWVDRDAFVKELIDAIHFLTNLLLVADATAEEVVLRYMAKRAVNAQRQAEGYTGNKDQDGRATDEPEIEQNDPGAAQRQAIIEEHLRRQREHGHA